MSSIMSSQPNMICQIDFTCHCPCARFYSQRFTDKNIMTKMSKLHTRDARFSSTSAVKVINCTLNVFAIFTMLEFRS